MSYRQRKMDADENASTQICNSGRGSWMPMKIQAPRAGHPRFFRAFTLASAKLNKKRGSAKKKKREKKRKHRARISAFLSWGGGGDGCMYVCM
jgi:hypothetical protein